MLDHDLADAVLIPLIPGLGFELTGELTDDIPDCLNPFDTRAWVRTLGADTSRSNFTS